MLGENLPMPHFSQSFSVSLPIARRYFPASQRVHVPAVVAPLTSEYVPLAQNTHSLSLPPLLAMYFPGLQGIHETRLSLEYVPSSHGMQLSIEDMPGDFDDLPWSHNTHSCCVAPRAFEYLPDSHFLHVFCDICPVWSEYVPLPHDTQ